MSFQNLKVCANCKLPKELDSFFKHKLRKDGFDSICKKCIIEFNYVVECECGAKVKKYYHKYHVEKLSHEKNLVYSKYLLFKN